MNVANRNSKITIAMPVFNGGDYFRLALESALAQTHENFEIIVVNDGSTDLGETERIATGTGSPKVRYFRQPNTGVASALNRVLEVAHGDFFCWLSHDDLYLANKLTAQVQYHSRLGKPNAILFSNFDHIDAQGRIVEHIQFDRRLLLRSSKLALLHSYINGCTLFVPMLLLRAAGPFDQSRCYTQDYDMWHRLLARHDFFLQSETLVQYRIHCDQATNHSQAAREADPLWIHMMNERTEVERAQMFGSRVCFFREMARFLDGTPYADAARFAHSNANRPLSDIAVSIIIPVCKNAAPATISRAVRSALEQTHPTIEVSVIPFGSTDTLAMLRHSYRNEPRVRVALPAAFRGRGALDRALRVATGDYIALLEPHATFATDKIERQLAAMGDAGAWISRTGWVAPEASQDVARAPGGETHGCATGRRDPSWSTLMIHRAVVAAGFDFADITCRKNDRVWAEIASRHPPLTLDEKLTIIDTKVIID